MLNSAILETAIGLIFVFLIFSLVASGIAEYFSAALDRRGEHLKHILFNLFDNDDPHGRAFLNLFVSHPMVQALNSTDWMPTFQSAATRIEQGIGKFQLVGAKWDLASNAVAASSVAKSAAETAQAAATAAAAAAANVQTAQKNFKPADPGSVELLRKAVEDAEAAAARAEAAASDAKQTAAAATQAAQATRNAKQATKNAAKDAAGDRLASSQAADVSAFATVSGAAVGSLSGPSRAGTGELKVDAKVEAPPAPADVQVPQTVEKPPAASDLVKRATEVIKRAGEAAAAAKNAATEAKKGASDAEKAKRGLYAELMAVVSVPKYIPDRTFADVVLHVLTSDETLQALAGDGGDKGQGVATAGGAVNSFWDRFGAAVGVVRGVASRLPDSDDKVKANVNRCLAAIDDSLKIVAHTSTEAAAVFAQLEKGTDELRGAIAAVPDDALRAALEREIETSVRPLHDLGQDILLLQRAAQAVALMADSSIKTAISAFLNQAGEDLDAFKTSLGTWYNDVMDHASGWYKRNTQRILIFIALGLCLLNNVDTVSLVSHLSTDPGLRAAAGKEARAFVDSSRSVQGTITPKPAEVQGSAKPPSAETDSAARYRAALEATRLPLWWSRDEWNDLWYSRNEQSSPRYAFSPNFTLILTKLTGLAISILAVSMGAPFWFDLLNKLVNVRLVGNRPDPSESGAPPATSPTTSPTT